MTLGKSARNEQRKLTATFVNGLAIALGAVGGFAPLIAVLQSGWPSLTVVAVVAVCLVGAGALTLGGTTPSRRNRRLIDFQVIALFSIFPLGALALSLLLLNDRRKRYRHAAHDTPRAK